MEPFEEAAGRRVRGCLLLLSMPAVKGHLRDADAHRSESKRLLPIIVQVASHHQSILELRTCTSILAALLAHLAGHERDELLIREILDCAARVHSQVFAIRSLFDRIDYPFDHADGRIATSQFLLRRIPAVEQVGALVQAADSMLRSLLSVHARCVGRLCEICEAVEGALGYQPLPQPVNNP
jgi:hypothetical protein